MAWTDPITWVFKQVWSASLFNQQIRDNLNYLKNRPKHIISLSTQQTFSTTDWTKVTGVDLQITLDVTSTLMFLIDTFVSGGTGATLYMRWDVWDVDNSVYLSSGSSTPLPSGLNVVFVPTAGTIFTSSALFENVAAGEHNYEIHVKPDSTNLKLEGPSVISQYAVMEV